MRRVTVTKGTESHPIVYEGYLIDVSIVNMLPSTPAAYLALRAIIETMDGHIRMEDAYNIKFNNPTSTLNKLIEDQ